MDAHTVGGGRRSGSVALVVLAVLAGLTIAYVDSRPTWDDTGVTVFALVCSAAVLGFFAPARHWLLALALGLWIPMRAIVEQRTLGALAMLVVLVFPLAGAYAGKAFRQRMPAASSLRR
jgi:uncharacterized membrane protein